MYVYNMSVYNPGSTWSTTDLQPQPTCHHGFASHHRLLAESHFTAAFSIFTFNACSPLATGQRWCKVSSRPIATSVPAHETYHSRTISETETSKAPATSGVSPFTTSCLETDHPDHCRARRHSQRWIGLSSSSLWRIVIVELLSWVQRQTRLLADWQLRGKSCQKR
jgi:hypothetical protein